MIHIPELDYIVYAVVILFLVMFSYTIKLIKDLSKTFEKTSMLGQLSHGFKKYIILNFAFQVAIIIALIYNNIIAKIHIFEIGPVSQGFVAVVILYVSLSYYVLYKEVSRFKTKEKEEFGAGVSEADLVKYGFVKIAGI